MQGEPQQVGAVGVDALDAVDDEQDGAVCGERPQDLREGEPQGDGVPAVVGHGRLAAQHGDGGPLRSGQSPEDVVAAGAAVGPGRGPGRAGRNGRDQGGGGRAGYLPVGGQCGEPQYGLAAGLGARGGGQGDLGLADPGRAGEQGAPAGVQDPFEPCE